MNEPLWLMGLPPPLRELIVSMKNLLWYREHNTLNFQLEKADDYFRIIREKLEAMGIADEKPTD